MDDPDKSRRVESNGPNSRPRDETISQTGPGLPNDSSSIVEVDSEEEQAIADSLKSPPGGPRKGD